MISVQVWQARLAQLTTFWFSLYTTIAAFGLYTCVFALRKTFTVASFEGIQFAGIDYKIWLILAQVLGYLLAKFIGIKLIAELPPHKRVVGILLMVGMAMGAWLGFALVPAPYNIIFLFMNGLPLGMGWGLIFGFLEGRKTTEVLAAGLSVGFIFSAGLAKTVGSYIMIQWGVTHFWMPLVACLVFLIPLLVFLFLLAQIPAPDSEDQLLRTLRKPMLKQDRWAFFNEFSIGLILLTAVYVLLTIFRELRDNFAAEIWTSLGYGASSTIFTSTETIVTLCVLVVIGSLMFIKNNLTAFIINHLIIFFGMLMVGLSTWLFQSELIGAQTWMISVGMGLYFGYISFNSVLFERMIATFKKAGTVGFLIYLADSFGYLGSVGVLLYKQFGQADSSWIDFFIKAAYGVSILSCGLISLALIYFVRKHRSLSKVQN